MLGVGIGLQNVLALYVDALEAAVDGRVEHVRDAKPWLMVEGNAPKAFEHLAGCIVRNMPVARKLVREGAHVARALHVVLAAQWVHADAQASDMPVAIARFAIPMRVVVPWLCSVTPRP